MRFRVEEPEIMLWWDKFWKSILIPQELLGMREEKRQLRGSCAGTQSEDMRGRGGPGMNS